MTRNFDRDATCCEELHDLGELITHVREGGLAGGIRLTGGERTLKRQLCSFRKRQRHRKVDRIYASEVDASNTARVGSHEHLCRARAVRSSKQIQRTITENLAYLFEIVHEPLVGVLR